MLTKYKHLLCFFLLLTNINLLAEISISSLPQKSIASKILIDSLKESPLIQICNQAHVDLASVKKLVNNGSEILYENPTSYKSAIQYCIDFSHYEIIRYFLKKLEEQQKHDFKKYYFYTSYSIAASEPHILELFLPFRDSIVLFKNTRETFLEKAINQAVLLDGLATSPYDWEGKENISVDSAILVIDILLAYGDKLNTNKGFTNYMSNAVKSPRIMAYLLSKNLDVNSYLVFHTQKYSLLDIYLRKIAERKRFFLEDEEVDLTKETKLLAHLEVLKQMLNKGAKVSSNELITPYQQLLIYAINSKNIILTKLLLENDKVNVNFFDLEGKTPLMYAHATNSDTIVELLYQHGAK